MVIKELLAQVKKVLRSGNVPDLDFDAECIVCDMLRTDKTRLILNHEKEAAPDSVRKALEAAQKRSQGYPLQYLLDRWEFYGLPMKTGEGVLIPRADTETLVDTVIGYYKENRGNRRILDLCSGSGCIAIALYKNISGAEVTAVENSADAMPYLVKNAELNKAKIRIIKGDVMNGTLMENFADKDDPGEYIRFGCIASNPPYLTDREMNELQTEVTYEPAYALSGGYDGLKFYRCISLLWREVLEDGGLMAFEIGSGQAEAVSGIMEQNGFGDIRIFKDIGGLDRVVVGRKLTVNSYQLHS